MTKKREFALFFSFGARRFRFFRAFFSSRSRAFFYSFALASAKARKKRGRPALQNWGDEVGSNRKERLGNRNCDRKLEKYTRTFSSCEDKRILKGPTS